jgi:nucleotide-binding universal stress UspA family protein
MSALKVALATELQREEQVALATAVAFAAQARARLVLVHATTEGEARATSAQPDELARAWGLPLESELLIHTCCDDVTDTLLDALGRVAPHLVVCGSHRPSGVTQLVSGSVAEAVARNVNVPTLVIPLEGAGLASSIGELRVKRVLVPVGDAESLRVSLAAVDWWVRSTGQARPEIVVFEADDGSSLPDHASLPADVRVRRVPLSGSLESAIEQMARDLDVSLIVMATRGHDGIKDALMGSHTERVLRAAERPLLIVPMTARW